MPRMLPSAKELSRELSSQLVLTDNYIPSDPGAGKLARAFARNQCQHRCDAPRSAANDVSCETVYYDFGCCFDFPAAEFSVGGSALRHRYGGRGKTNCAAPSEPAVQLRFHGSPSGSQRKRS